MDQRGGGGFRWQNIDIQRSSPTRIFVSWSLDPSCPCCYLHRSPCYQSWKMKVVACRKYYDYAYLLGSRIQQTRKNILPQQHHHGHLATEQLQHNVCKRTQVQQKSGTQEEDSIIFSIHIAISITRRSRDSSLETSKRKIKEKAWHYQILWTIANQHRQPGLYLLHHIWSDRNGLFDCIRPVRLTWPTDEERAYLEDSNLQNRHRNFLLIPQCMQLQPYKTSHQKHSGLHAEPYPMMAPQLLDLPKDPTWRLKMRQRIYFGPSLSKMLYWTPCHPSESYAVDRAAQLWKDPYSTWKKVLQQNASVSWA